jgi:hypothetical protein
MRMFTQTTDPGGNGEPKRGWNCLHEGAIASYVDQTIGDRGRAGVERHLSTCTYCRNAVADVVKLRRVGDAPAVPSDLIARVRFVGSAKPKRWAWGWPLAAAGSLACLLFALTLRETNQTLTLPSWPAPSGPRISKSQPQPPAAAEPREVIRGSGLPQQLPTVTYPARDGVVGPDGLEIRWSAVPHAIYYQVRVLTSAGELVWQSDTTANLIRTPDRMALTSGKYFVLVSAVMENGRMRKSDPQPFQVASAP